MLKFRLISGTLLVGGLLLTVFWHSPLASGLFAAGAVLCLTLALLEFFELSDRIGDGGFRVLTIAAAADLILLQVLAGRMADAGMLQLVELTVVAGYVLTAVLLAFREPDMAAGTRQLMTSFGGFLYLAWTMSFLPRIYYFPDAQAHGPYLMFFVILVTKCGDIGGYFLGSMTAARPNGNHKLVPRLSPKKSWEGLIGGILLSAVVACGLVHVMGDKLHLGGQAVLTYQSAIIFAVLFTLLGLAGDLVESMLKRAADVKDSGSRIPGMGGMLDVIDSLVFVGPVFYCYLLFVTM